MSSSASSPRHEDYQEAQDLEEAIRRSLEDLQLEEPAAEPPLEEEFVFIASPRAREAEEASFHSASSAAVMGSCSTACSAGCGGVSCADFGAGEAAGSFPFFSDGQRSLVPTGTLCNRFRRVRVTALRLKE